MSELNDKVKKAISYLQNFQPNDEPYHVCYSGGKDSDVIRLLCDMANVHHELHNSHTTVDAPETVRYIRSIPNIIIDKPEKSMWRLIADKGIPPTRLIRYCCEELKEKGGMGKKCVTGVRWAESKNRKKNQGLVTIIGKKKTLKLIEDADANFQLTPKGGWL